MKTVFENRMVAHVWAQRNQAQGRSSNGQFYFNGDTIYSYGSHFPIASFVKDLQGNDRLLFVTRSYSVTTSRHIAYVRQALSQEQQSMIVYCYTPTNSHSSNIEHYDLDIKEYLRMLSQYANTKIRQSTRDKIACNINVQITRRNEYGKLFIKDYKPLVLPENIAQLAEDLAKQEKNKMVALKRKRTLAKNKRLTEAESILGKRENWPELWRDKYEAIECDYDVRNTFDSYLREKIGVLLRLVDNEIVTSKGARFPIDHAKKAFTLIKKIHDNKGSYTHDNHTVALGNFRIDEIESTGNVKAGCHYVKYEEIELMAKRLNIA